MECLTVADGLENYKSAQDWFAERKIGPGPIKAGQYALCYSDCCHKIVYTKIKWGKCKYNDKTCRRVGCKGKLLMQPLENKGECCFFGDCGMRDELLIYPVPRNMLAAYLL